MTTVFTKEFWIKEWEKTKSGDTYSVHKGFATAQYWDKVSATYNTTDKEKQHRKIETTLERFRSHGLLFDGMKVLEIGCGTGELALGLARHGARVTAMDFSRGMLDRFHSQIPPELADQITLLHEDWHQVDIASRGWTDKFDLVIAFMSPGVNSLEAFNRLMAASRKGCAVKGWASKKPDPVMAALWEKLMDRPLDDRPQSILYKINLLFSMDLFPGIWFDTMEWDQTATLEKEIENQLIFFKKVSDLPEQDLCQAIEENLKPMVKEGTISRKQRGLTATAVWTKDKW